MKNAFQIEAKFLSYWHIGTGRGSGHNLDALVEKDAHNLPYVPGRTLKGLFRDALCKLDKWQDTDYADLLFGIRTDDDQASRNETEAGLLRFSNLELIEKAELLADESLVPYLYQSIASTAIDRETGSAKDQSLRLIEVVVPVTLQGCIQLLEPMGELAFQNKQRIFLEEQDLQALLSQAASLITHIGAHKNRGFGRVSMEVKA